jgi:hypothetical protein
VLLRDLEDPPRRLAVDEARLDADVDGDALDRLVQRLREGALDLPGSARRARVDRVRHHARHDGQEHEAGVLVARQADGVLEGGGGVRGPVVRDEDGAVAAHPIRSSFDLMILSTVDVISC